MNYSRVLTSTARGGDRSEKWGSLGGVVGRVFIESLSLCGNIHDALAG